MEFRNRVVAVLILSWSSADAISCEGTSLAFSHALRSIQCDARGKSGPPQQDLDGSRKQCSIACRKDPELGRITLGRRELFGAGVSAAAVSIAPIPAEALDFGSTLAIYGNDGEVPPTFLESLTDTLASRLGTETSFLSKRPPTVKIPRTFLFRPFSVLLMRSSYETMDELDFVPTDKFQKEFFLLRSTEWEKYLAETDAKQGDLSDPMYFDFISAAQYATITQEMQRAQNVFEERTGAEGTVSVVRRDQKFQDNELLAPAFFEMVGDKIYAALLANYTGPDFYSQPPPPCPSGDVTCVVSGLKQLYRVVVENGYALDYQVEDLGGVPVAEYKQAEGRLAAWRERTRRVFETPTPRGEGRRLRVTLQVPCTLWGRQWLGLRRGLLNDHDIMVGMAYLRKSGQAAVVSTKMDQNSIIREYTLL